MALLNDKNVNNAKTVSDENTAMLPETKQSKSSIITKKTNKLLIFIAIGMLGIFVIGALLTANRNQSDFNDLSKEIDASVDTEKQTDIPYLHPVVEIEPEELKIENQPVGEEAFRQILLSVVQNPIKITDISLSYSMDGLNLDSADCTARDKLPSNSSCTLNISWTPAKKENKNLFIVVKYNELADEGTNAKDAKSDISKKIGLILQSSVPEKQEEPEEEDSFFDEEPEEEEEDDYEVAEDLAPQKSEPKEDDKPKRIIKPDDCKKYASKAYDFSGTFIGWVQGNNDVYAPNCSRVIGNMEEDGMVIESGSGRVIGKGTVLDKKKSEEKRIELTLPLLDETMQAVSGPVQPDFEEVRANRELVKSGSYNERRTTISDDEDLYQLKDTLGIYRAQQKKLIPYGISDATQISSMPKDQRYVLRQSKPIPAVLNRPVYLSGETGGQQDITATVERNVYGGDGRTIIIPSGSQLIGVATTPESVLQAVQKISIVWNRLIRPDGAEFDLAEVGNYSADAQGRAGVPGKNDTGYMQQLFIKPLLYSALPVAMESIFPSTSKIVTRVKRSDGTYNTIDDTIDADDEETGSDYGYAWDQTQTVAEMTSKDKMKAEVQQNFKSVMQKLIEDSAKQKIPFTVPSGTRIQVFLNKDIMLRITEDMEDLMEEGGLNYQEGVEYNFDSTGGATVINSETFRTRSDNVTARTDEEEEVGEEE
ncbi:MAG: TrbI/VirB10 family protein [bacterium]|nr:TrbI/VirB10 family protein [bacterium]